MTEHTGKAIGQQLGNYRLQRLLGTGGFADVYLGEHLHLGTLAAIKVLHTKLTGDEVDLFLQEARLIGRLAHPHIIRVFDFDVADMTPFLVMDYAPGGTLRQRHPKKTQVPLTSIIEYVKQVSAGLQYAHDQKLVHRDIKPENMLVNQYDNIVISDFGVASVAHSTESQTIVELAGTLPYMAPEQLQGLPRPASDQYALAVVVYEWISGERPFQGTFAEIVTQHMVKQPPFLYGRFPEVSPAIESVIFKALSKDARDRFVTIQEFATALELSYRGETTSKPQARDTTTISTPMGQETQPMPTTRIDMTPTPTTDQRSRSNISSSDRHTVLLPDQITSLSEHSTPAEKQLSPTLQSYVKQHWRLVSIIVPLLVILVSAGTLYAIQHSSSSAQQGGSIVNNGNTRGTVTQPPPTTAPVTPTPTINSQATTTAQQAVTATQTAVAQAKATQVAQQTTATQTAVAQITATAQTATPQGLYRSVTSQPPSFSDSLAAQSSRSWDSNSACVFSGGKYVISSPVGYYQACSAVGTKLCNLGYQVQMTTLSGNGGGLFFRDSGNGYRFHVGSDSSYDLVNNTYSITSGRSTAAQQGTNVTNTLTIIAQGSKISLYINAQYITSITDKTSSCGSIGLMAVGGKAAFSNVKVWSL